VIEEPIELREYVAEQMHDAWCNEVGADVVWRGTEMTEEQIERWMAVADAAIAAVEWEHMVVPSAGLLVAVYSDGVIDFRWPEGDEE
jgi:hypothetical protein